MGADGLFGLMTNLIVIATQAKEHNLNLSQCSIQVFEQTWGDTSCGFGGWAGQSMTKAFTIIFTDYHNGKIHVFIDGRHAYTVQRPTDEFLKCIANQRMPSASSFSRKEYESSEVI